MRMAQMSGFVWTASAGETFDMIALAVYGNEKYACDLMGANPKWARTARFEGGEEIAIPVVFGAKQRKRVDGRAVEGVSGWARLPDGAGTSLK